MPFSGGTVPEEKSDGLLGAACTDPYIRAWKMNPNK
jgi:hypothetical protein